MVAKQREPTQLVLKAGGRMSSRICLRETRYPYRLLRAASADSSVRPRKDGGDTGQVRTKALRGPSDVEVETKLFLHSRGRHHFNCPWSEVVARRPTRL